MAAGKKYKQKDQKTGGKIDKPGPDNPAFSGKDSDEELAFPDGKSLFNNLFLGAEPPKIFEDDDPPYAGPPDVEADKAKKVEDIRKKIAKNGDKPTTAAGKIGEKDLPKTVKEVDPEGKGQVMPELYKNGQQIMNLLNMGSAASGGGGGGGQQPQTPNSGSPISAGIQIVMNDSFTGALCILVKRFSFEVVINVFIRALENGKIDKVNYRYRQIVKNGVSNLIRLALYFGPLNIPVSEYDETIYGDIVPSKVVAQKDVPDFYEKQYYELADDPYPGYIEWRSKDGTDSVWVKSDPKDLVFRSSNEEVYSISEREIADDLNVYMIRVEYNNTLIYNTILGPYELNDILARQEYNINANLLNLNMGNNAGGQPQNSQGGGGGGGANMIGQLAGMLQQLIQQFTGDQLPKSVLNQGDMNQVMENFKKDMGINNQVFELGKKAMGGGSPMDALGNLGGLQGIMGGFQSGGGGSSGSGGQQGAGGSLGGGSAGGGGGAGSGFADAPGAGEYTGGGISISGLKDIQDMLTLLGVQ
jgi:hypothetical protein